MLVNRTLHFSIRLRRICHFRNLSGGELWWRTPGVPLRFLSIFWEKNLGVSQGYARGTPEVRHFRQPPASPVAPHTYCTETAQRVCQGCARGTPEVRHHNSPNQITEVAPQPPAIGNRTACLLHIIAPSHSFSERALISRFD